MHSNIAHSYFSIDPNDLVDDTSSYQTKKEKPDVGERKDLNPVSKPRDYESLLQILLPFFPDKTNILSKAFLIKCVEEIDLDENRFEKDPNHLVMIDRQDFTNFLVFFDQYSANFEIISKLLSFDFMLKKISTGSDNSLRKIYRYLYRIIYFVHNHKTVEESPLTNEKPFEDSQIEITSVSLNPSFLKVEKEPKNKQGAKPAEKIEQIQEERKESEEANKKEGKPEWDIDEKLISF